MIKNSAKWRGSVEQKCLTPCWNDLKEPEQAYEWSVAEKRVFSRAVHLLGFEFDGTACFRKGAVAGPEAIRQVSDGIESFSPYLNKDLEEMAPFYDLGNLPVGHTGNIDQDYLSACNVFEAFTAEVDFASDGVRFLMLGGEHSISYAPLKKYLESFSDLVVIHLDAHADLRDGYLGHHYSHASVIRRALDHFGADHQLIQYGIRSGTADEYKYMRTQKTLRTSLDSFIEDVESIASDRPIYLTLDLDYFDPAYLPGTGTPEPGGETFHSFVKLMKILRRKKLVGADVVELAPSLDSSNNSAVFASKVVRELLIVMGEEK
jgi:agmatinase